MDFWNLYTAHYPTVRRYALHLAGDEALADDVVQEVFCKAQDHAPELRDPAKLKSWLLRITRNHWLDQVRQPQALPLDEARLAERLATPSALRTLEQKELCSCVQDKLGRLKEEQRTVLALFDVLGLTHAEIAETLEISVGNAKVRLHRARTALREVVEQHCEVTRDGRDRLVCQPKATPG